VAPERCFSVGDAVDSPIPRTWGLSVQLYALRRKGDGGFGDTQALEDLAGSPANAAPRRWRSVRCTPCSAADTRRYSPYSPSSRLFLNSLYARRTILGEHAMRAAIDATGLA
jgi:4-alpha-glucanotransferase